jgi:acyl-CoA thioester hydrolase
MREEMLAAYPVVVRQAVAWGDMDYYRHVNNVVYFRYFENARLEYFRQLDWFEYERQTGIGPILASTQARFRKPLSYPDSIAVGVRVADILDDRFTMEYRLVSERVGDVAADGNGVLVTFHYAQGRKVPMPADLRERIENLEKKCKQ